MCYSQKCKSITKKELELAFSDYIEVYDGTDDTSNSRSIPFITLILCCYYIASWEFMSLNTKTHVFRFPWKVMMTMPTVIDAMDAFDEETVLVVDELALNIRIQVVPVSEETVQQQEDKENIPQVRPVGMMPELEFQGSDNDR